MQVKNAKITLRHGCALSTILALAIPGAFAVVLPELRLYVPAVPTAF